MESLLLYLSMTCCLVVVEAAPWGSYETTPQQQACGDKLADILSLVCSGRGYNNAFRPERSSSRRFRRQIVDECCRRSCNVTMLQLYCKAETTEAPNIQIWKRSDSEAQSAELQQDQDITRRSIKPLTSSTESLDSSTTTEHTESSTKNNGPENYKLLNLLDHSKHDRFKEKTKKNSQNKSTQNDTTEDEFYKQNTLPPIRHHKNLQRQLRARKTSGKTKREKNTSDESKQTFQIGTIKPFFAGRALVSHRGNYIHQHHASRP